VGINVQMEKAPDGAKEISVGIFCRPCRGLIFFGRPTHGFTVGYYRPLLRS
jgi:hypothetical protein